MDYFREAMLRALTLFRAERLVEPDTDPGEKRMPQRRARTKRRRVSRPKM